MQPEPVRLHSVEFGAVVVTPRTEWVFAKFRDADGTTAEVEVTAANLSEGVVKGIAQAVDGLRATPIADERDVPAMLGIAEDGLRADLAGATVVSALRAAVSLTQSLELGVSLCEALGGEATTRVPLYANINRGLFASGRTPGEFAKAAERAASEGFRAVKCAPFDEVTPGCGTAEAVRLAATGIQRVAAVTAAVGPEVTVMVDCHSRFDEESALAVCGELAALEVAWFEEPVDPAADSDVLARIAAHVPLPVAGGEHCYGEDQFAELTESGAIRIIMPDVKFCGGAAVAARAGRAAVASGRGVSLHCPSGPLSLLTSGHATAAIPGAMRLEHAVYEADWRATFLSPAESISDGYLHLTAAPGLGAGLDWNLLQRIGRVWREP